MEKIYLKSCIDNEIIEIDKNVAENCFDEDFLNGFKTVSKSDKEQTIILITDFNNDKIKLVCDVLTVLYKYNENIVKKDDKELIQFIIKNNNDSIDSYFSLIFYLDFFINKKCEIIITDIITSIISKYNNWFVFIEKYLETNDEIKNNHLVKLTIRKIIFLCKKMASSEKETFISFDQFCTLIKISDPIIITSDELKEINYSLTLRLLKIDKELSNLNDLIKDTTQYHIGWGNYKNVLTYQTSISIEINRLHRKINSLV